MDIVSDVKKWLKMMGYDKNVDNINFKTMITPATAHIWMQLIKNVRPKQEIELIRKNILINRLSSKRGLPPGISEIVKVHPLKELEIYNRKRELEKRLEIVKHRVRQNEEKLKELMMQNRTKCKDVTIEKLGAEIESNQRYVFLLKAKAEQLKKEIIRIDEILHTVKTLTPVEEIKATDEKEVLDTLKSCAQKLEMHVEQQRVNNENSALFSSTVLGNSTYIRISAKKKVSSAKKQLIPPQSRRALTPLVHNSVFNDTLFHLPDVGRTLMSIKDESFLMKSGQFSHIDIKFNETKVKATLQGLVHSYHRRLIWSCLQQIFTECRTEVSEICMNTDERVVKKDPKNIAVLKLHHVHVKNELMTRKHGNNIKSLETEIEKYKNMLLQQLNNSNQAKIMIEYQMKAAGLRAALKFMQKEVGKETSLTTNENEMISLNDKLRNVKEQIIVNLRDIEQYLNNFKTVNNKLLRTRDFAMSLVQKLNHFVEDSDWTLPLRENLNSREIDAFSKFPLEENRVVMHGCIPLQEDIDKDTLYKFLNLIHKPCCFPEKVLHEIAETKARMENFEKSNDKIEDTHVHKFTLRELNERGNFMEKALQDLNNLIEKDGRGTTSNLGKLKEIVDTWLEMPFGRYISKNRFVDHQNFAFYEKQYDYYYNQL